MKYSYSEGVKKDKKRVGWIFWLLVLVVVAIAAYVAVNAWTPNLISLPLSEKSAPDATQKKLQATPPAADKTHLYIPQLNIDLPVAAGGDSTALQHGAWQPTNNDITPQEQGVMVVCASRLLLGLTPWQTWYQSPFYNLDKLQTEDELYLDYSGQRYAYRVREVSPLLGEVQTQAVDDKKHLALYACSADGQSEQFVVIRAEQVGTVATEGSEQPAEDHWW